HGIRSAVPAVDEVAGVQRLAVGPLQAVLQGEGVGHAVLAHGVALGQIGDLLVVGVVGVQAGEGVDGQDGAVNGAVQRGVQLVGLGSQVSVQGGVVSVRCGVVQLGEHEVLVAERSPVDVGQVV